MIHILRVYYSPDGKIKKVLDLDNLKYRMVLSAFFAYFFFIYLDQNDISTDLNDTFPWNHEFGVASQKPAEFSGTGDDQGQNTSGFHIDIQIADTAKRAAGTDIDDFFALQFKQSHKDLPVIFVSSGAVSTNICRNSVMLLNILEYHLKGKTA